MITFTQEDNTTFVYRVAAVALSEGQVLLHRSVAVRKRAAPGRSE